MKRIIVTLICLALATVGLVVVDASPLIHDVGTAKPLLANKGETLSRHTADLNIGGPTPARSTQAPDLAASAEDAANGNLTALESLQRSLPAGLFPVVVDTLQGDSGEAYRIVQSASETAAYRSENRTHGMRAGFGRESVSLSSLEGGKWTWGIALEGYGRRGAVGNLTAPQLTVAGNRINYVYAEGITQWYVNGRLGLQQGFTIESPPGGVSGEGEVELQLSLRGGVRAEVEADGRSATLRQMDGLQSWRYAGLYVYDRTGRELEARLEAVPSGLAIVVQDLHAWYPVTIDPIIQHEHAKLTASDGASFDHFGSSVSVHGDTIVVGAPGADGNVDQSGAAYVFVKPSGGWGSATETAKLTASDGSVSYIGALRLPLSDAFGNSVSVHGDTIVVGAPGADGNVADSGAAYVFVKPSGGWVDGTETAKLTASDGSVRYTSGALRLPVNDSFGSSVSVDDETSFRRSVCYTLQCVGSFAGGS